MVWDFRSRDTFAPSYLDSSLNLSGKVEERAEQGKLIKYAQLEHEFEIVSICIETMGRRGPNGFKFIQEIHKRILGRLVNPDRLFS